MTGKTVSFEFSNEPNAAAIHVVFFYLKNLLPNDSANTKDRSNEAGQYTDCTDSVGHCLHPGRRCKWISRERAGSSE